MDGSKRATRSLAWRRGRPVLARGAPSYPPARLPGGRRLSVPARAAELGPRRREALRRGQARRSVAPKAHPARYHWVMQHKLPVVQIQYFK